MLIPQIESFNQYEAVISANSYSVIYFYSPECYYCNLMSPVLKRVAGTCKMDSDKIEFYTLDTSLGWPGLFNVQMTLKIMGMPATFIFHESEMVARSNGYKTRKEFEEWLFFYTAQDKTSALKSCRFEDPVTSGAPINESPLILYTSVQDGNSYLKNALQKSTKPVFVTLSLPGTSYYRSLKLLLQRIALSMADDATHLLFSLDDTREHTHYVERYFLRYRPHCKMFITDPEESFSECKFDGVAREAGEYYANWIKACMDARRVLLNPDREYERQKKENEEPNSNEETVDIVEISSTITLFELVNEVSDDNGILVVLCYDDSPYSKAMLDVHDMASKSHAGSSVKFCRIDFYNYDSFVEPLHLDQGPTTIVYRDKGDIASKKGALELKHYEEWLKQVFQLPRGETHFRIPSVKSSVQVPSIVRSESRASSAVSKWESAPEENLLQGRVKCDGVPQNDRPRPSTLARLLKRPKPFHDRELGCVIVPHDAQEGLQLGRACFGQSAFNLTLQLSSDNPFKILFKVEFSADVNLNRGGRRARFESAILMINFWFDDADGVSHPLKLREVHPTDMKGTETSVHYGKGSEASLGLGVGYAAASVNAEGKVTKNASFFRVTMPRVKGGGVLTNRAHWTFEEDGGEAGQNGLDNRYELSVLLSSTSIPTGEIWMTFWGQAVLWLPYAKETIKLGSNEVPYKRVLPLPIDSD